MCLATGTLEHLGKTVRMHGSPVGVRRSCVGVRADVIVHRFAVRVGTGDPSSSWHVVRVGPAAMGVRVAAVRMTV